MSYDNGNIFAKILRKEIPCDIVYENEHSLVFCDIQPVSKIHVLVIPKGEYTEYYDFIINAKQEEKNSFEDAIIKSVKILNIDKTGFRVISNIGSDARQEVPHYHLHILGGQKLGSIIGE